MKVEEIERLLTEFYEGNTTESQEEALRDYFRTCLLYTSDAADE